MTDSGLGSSIIDSLSRSRFESSLSMTDSGLGSSITDSSSSRFDSLSNEIEKEFERIKNQKYAKLDEFSSEKLKLEIYSFGKSSQSENNLKMLISKFFKFNS